ncbi:hypothetical protein N0V90_008992 [Kalmusia sp. IMI 367209]|nr:hypothetical protein N0V90_008992 [Kalmusia sp. IMI 367209]
MAASGPGQDASLDAPVPSEELSGGVTNRLDEVQRSSEFDRYYNEELNDEIRLSLSRQLWARVYGKIAIPYEELEQATPRLFGVLTTEHYPMLSETQRREVDDSLNDLFPRLNEQLSRELQNNLLSRQGLNLDEQEQLEGFGRHCVDCS